MWGILGHKIDQKILSSKSLVVQYYKYSKEIPLVRSTVRHKEKKDFPYFPMPMYLAKHC